MKNSKSSQPSKHNLMCALSGRAVPLGFNLPSNRYPLSIAFRSDCTSAQAWFYEYHGLYWYSLTVESHATMNSVPFLSIQNCISAFRLFLHGYGFVYVDHGLAETRLRLFRSKATPKSSEV